MDTVDQHIQKMFRAIALLSWMLMVRAGVPHHLGHYGGSPYYSSVIPVDEAPKPYQFAYHAEAIGGASARQESADGAGRVLGSYSLSDTDGRSRVVDYVADKAGFRASVKTNEPGTKSESPADVSTVSTAGDASSVHTATDVYRGGLHRYGLHGGYGYPHGSGYLGHQGYRGLHGGYGYPHGSGYLGLGLPYQFAYQAEAIGGASARQESADGAGRVLGSYSLSDTDGRSRVVDYVADKAGFRASVKTNEPGTKSESPADVSTVSTAGDASSVHTATDVYRGGLHRYGLHGGYGYPHGSGYLGHQGYRGLHGGHRGLGYYGASGKGLGYRGYSPYGRAGYNW